MKYLLILIALISIQVHAQEKKGKSIRYEYKKFEKFDFDEIGVEGEAGSPGDLSINPRARNEFRNKLPERTNFNREIKKSVEVIR